MSSIDHLIVGSPDLDAGIRYVEQQTGVRAAYGGKHPSFGTHNALLSLGHRVYLEILAPDPEALQVTGMLSGVKDLKKPALFTWAASVSPIESITARLREAGWSAANAAPGSRTRPDGSVLRWKSLKIPEFTDPAVPFFIEWDADSQHPSEDSPAGCSLESFVIAHPKPEALHEIFEALGIQVEVIEADHLQFAAAIRTPTGTMTLS